MKEIIIFLILLFAFGLMVWIKASSKNEKDIEKESLENWRRCVDDCINCPNKNWCTFSEVKKLWKN